MDLTKLLTRCYYLAFIWYCVVYICCAEYTFTTQPQSVLVSEDEPVHLTCAWTPALSNGDFVRWIHFSKLGDGILIEESNADYILVIDESSSGPKSSQLLIHSAKRLSGEYGCNIYNRMGGVAVSDDVAVGTITCTPRNDSGELGVSPLCSSSVPVSLIWYRGETTVRTSSQNGMDLYATALTDEDYGVTFTCKAFDGANNTVIGTCQTTPLLFNVRIEKSPPGPLYIGDSFNLNCLANGNADNYVYSWRFGLNKLLDSSTDFSGKRYAIRKETPNIFTYRNVQNGLNNKVITCIVSRENREDTLATYTVELSTSTTTIPTTHMKIAENTNLFTRRPTILTTSRSSTSDDLSTEVNTDGQQDPAMSQTIIIIVIGVVAIIFIIFVIICHWGRRLQKNIN